MKTPLALAALVFLSAAARAADETMTASAPAPQVAAMTSAVAAFFSPGNLSPDPVTLNPVLRALQTVGRPDGLTREQAQPVIEQLRASADHFLPIDEERPPYGLGSSTKLEVLAGPFRAWLSDGEKGSILREQEEYGAKLSPAERRSLQDKMSAMAAALGSLSQDSAVAADGPASSGKIRLTLQKPAPSRRQDRADAQLEKALEKIGVRPAELRGRELVEDGAGGANTTDAYRQTWTAWTSRKGYKLTVADGWSVFSALVPPSRIHFERAVEVELPAELPADREAVARLILERAEAEEARQRKAQQGEDDRARRIRVAKHLDKALKKLGVKPDQVRGRELIEDQETDFEGKGDYRQVWAVWTYKTGYRIRLVDGMRWPARAEMPLTVKTFSAEAVALQPDAPHDRDSLARYIVERADAREAERR